MNKRQAYNNGRTHGYNVASWNDLPELGSKIDKRLDWVGLGETVTLENVAEYFSMICHEAEDNSRQYSPFEFTASEINDCPNADSLWDEFDRGIEAGILENWKQRKDYYK